jgi:hypothetical protein
MTDDYQAYMIRLQRRKESAGWRVTLENAHTGEILRFRSRLDLMHHLFQLMTNDPETAEPDTHYPLEP